MSQTEAHPELETLAAYVDGLLEEGQRRVVATHLDSCPDCYALVVEVMGDDTEEAEETGDGAAPTGGVSVKAGGAILPFPPRQRWPAWLQLAAASLAIFAVGPFALLSRADARFEKAVHSAQIVPPFVTPLAEGRTSVSVRRGGPGDVAYRVCGSRAESRECQERFRRARSLYLSIPRFARSREANRRLSAIALELDPPEVARQRIAEVRGWESDCILRMLHDRAALDDEALAESLEGLRCSDPHDQVTVDLNRALLSYRAGDKAAACRILAGLPAAARASQEAKLWGPPDCSR